MNTFAFCPISNQRINERVVRTNATLTFIFILLYVVTNSLWVVAFLAVDFLLRGTRLIKYSLVGFLSKQIVKFMPFKSRLINAGPKMFAARIGFVFSVSIVAASFIGFPLLALSLAAVLGLFSFLESAFGLCVACKIYPFVYKLQYRS